MTKSTLGFTLIEVLISMFIMSMLTILVSTTVRTSVQNKKKLEARVASETALYDTLRILRLDIERAFHYQDIFYDMEVAAIQKSQPGAPVDGQNPGQPNSPPSTGVNPNQGAPLPPPPIKLTHFLGESNSFHFTTLNHFRTKYNAQESNQMEVGYTLDRCQKRKGKGQTKCLWRRFSTQIDDKVDEGGARTILAEDVTKFKLSYLSGKENDPWVDQWRSDNRGRADHRDKFPNFVKVELEMGEKGNPDFRPVAMTVVVRIQFPNNQPLLQSQGQNTRQGQGL